MNASLGAESMNLTHSTVDHELVRMTERFEQASLVNGAVCMGLGLPLNLLLMWVVACKSPEELRVYKKVLISTTIIDTAFLAMCFLVQPVSTDYEYPNSDLIPHSGSVRRARPDDNVRSGARPPGVGARRQRDGACVEQPVGGELAAGHGGGALRHPGALHLPLHAAVPQAGALHLALPAPAHRHLRPRTGRHLPRLPLQRALRRPPAGGRARLHGRRPPTPRRCRRKLLLAIGYPDG
jgi:hypothetical protein